MSKSDDDIPDLMSALKASLDAVKARDADQLDDVVRDRGALSEMTPAQSLAHRYAAEAGRRSDALRAFRECLRYAAVAEANEDTVCADAHRADARAAMHMYPEMLAGLEAAISGGLFRP